MRFDLKLKSVGQWDDLGHLRLRASSVCTARDKVYHMRHFVCEPVVVLSDLPE